MRTTSKKTSLPNENNLKNEDGLENEEGRGIEFPNVISSLLITLQVAKVSLLFDLKLFLVARLGPIVIIRPSQSASRAGD